MIVECFGLKLSSVVRERTLTLRLAILEKVVVGLFLK